MKPRKPSLAQIEAEWTRPSDRLITRIEKNDPTVDPELRRRLEKDPQFQKYIEELHEPEAEDPSRSTDDRRADYFLELADRRHKAQERLKQATLNPGSLVAIDRLIGPGGELPFDLPRTAVVLLDRLDRSTGVWYGWMVGPETGYAGDSDYVLQEDDGPFDPSLAGIVQTWNRVWVYNQTIARIVGELRHDRLQAVRALYREFRSRRSVGEAVQGPGSAGPRQTSNGFTVFTGKPIRQDSDPRCRYRKIYQEVRDKVYCTAKAALAGKPWWEAIRDTLLDSLTSEEPELTFAMGESSREVAPQGTLADRFRVRLDVPSEKVLGLQFTRLGDDRSTLRLFRNGHLIQKLNADERDKTFRLDESGTYELEIADDGSPIDRLKLTESKTDSS